MDNLLTTQQAAKRLKLSQPRIYQLISEGHLPARKFGRDYLIREDDLRLVENRPKVGRPPKAKAGAPKAGRKKGGKRS